jgi:signal transduction histidine kinase
VPPGNENIEAPLVAANKEIDYQNQELEKRATELIMANRKWHLQHIESEKRAADLAIANKELLVQNVEKEKRAAELVIANSELAFQNKEKEKRAAELIIANKELIVQNSEKEKRAAELVIANKELAFQNEEKGKRAAELAIANKELLIQNIEKEKRAAELVIANKELAFQNEEKEKRAAELSVANTELLFQNGERGKRAMELELAVKELDSFSYSVSHDLRAPLRAINGFARVMIDDYLSQLDQEAQAVLTEIISNSERMGELIDNLLSFSRVGKQNVSLVNLNITDLVNSVIMELKQEFPTRNIAIEIKPLANAKADRSMLKQVFVNLISNAFKYTGKNTEAIIEIGSCPDENDYCTYYVKDNGVGFDMQYYDNLFKVFQRLHSSSEFEGTGVGLAIIQRIISKHNGKVWAEGKVNGGACFYFSLPLNETRI